MRDFKGCKNYTLIGEEWLGDVASRAYVLKHDKTGARVCLISNDDENKTFVIGFKTIPHDSTGVAHILEHSVFCGSERYPVKDTMTEVSKGSLNTYLNACTYPDRTLYPLSSCNEKDFFNLIKIYLDAVFCPLIYKNSNSFMQEGWHYELEDEKAEIKINGVVYNEMKGEYSSPEDALSAYSFMSLFPDTQYGIEAGGDPVNIPDLSYEDFLEFHRTMYHPSNCRIYIYGDTDFEEKLQFIDEEYLSKYEYREMNTDISIQPSFDKPKYITKEYAVSDDENVSDSTFLTYNVCCANFNETEIIDAMSVINYALVSVPGARLKERLINAGIGKDVYSILSTECGQKQFSIFAEGANPDNEAEFVRIIEDTMEEIVRDGFDKKALLAAITSQEFSYRESDFGFTPRGLVFGMYAFENWNYSDDDIFSALKQNAVFKRLRDNVETDYFETVLSDRVLKNTHKTVLKLVPVRGLKKVLDDEFSKKLADKKAGMSSDEIKKIVKQTKALKRYQESDDSDEALSTIPTLSISDIPLKGRHFDYEVNVKDGITFVEAKQFTNDIAYCILSFSMDGLPIELIPNAAVLKILLSQLDTDKYKYSELTNEIGLTAGGLSVSAQIYKSAYDGNVFKTAFEGKFKTLHRNISDTLALLGEIMFNTKLDDKKRIRDVLEETRTRIQGNLVSSGHSVALSRVNSYTGGAAMMSEMLFGMEEFRVIEDLCDNFDEKIDAFIDGMKSVLDYVISRDNLTVSVSMDEDKIGFLEDEILRFLKNIPTKEVSKQAYNLVPVKRQEAYTFSSQVQYVCLGGNFKNHGLKYNGSLTVLRNLLSSDYLWNKVRVKGGAYGVMLNFARSGESYMVSYRDPNLRETIKAFEGAYRYVLGYTGDADEVSRYVITTIGEVDVPFTPSLYAYRTFLMYMNGITNEMMDREREEILGTTAETIKNLAKYIKVIKDDHCLSCVGSDEAVAQESKLFLTTEPLYHS